MVLYDSCKDDPPTSSYSVSSSSILLPTTQGVYAAELSGMYYFVLLILFVVEYSGM